MHCAIVRMFKKREGRAAGNSSHLLHVTQFQSKPETPEEKTALHLNLKNFKVDDCFLCVYFKVLYQYD